MEKDIKQLIAEVDNELVRCSNLLESIKNQVGMSKNFSKEMDEVRNRLEECLKQSDPAAAIREYIKEIRDERPVL